jgi:hypothetical protein
MSAAVPTSLASGTIMCCYVVTVCYDGKKEFVIGTFHIPRHDTEAETEKAAFSAATLRIDQFFADHFPSGVPRPTVLKATLGHQTFIPDDYEWRRGRET